MNTKLLITERKPAVCRNCGMVLRGDAFMYGGLAFHPTTGEQCKQNKYGGFICSEICDKRASYDLEKSQPGNIMGAPRP